MQFPKLPTRPSLTPGLRNRSRVLRAAADGTEPAEPTLVAKAYEEILERIFDGRFEADTVLSELVLAQDLGMSRTPVHDALRLLAIDGFVTQERNRRARVASFTGDDLFEVFEMRKLLEGHAAELAAGRMDSRQLAPLRAMAEALHEGLNARDWSRRWADFDEEFHRAIAEASGMSRLGMDIMRYRLLHRGINRFSTDPKSLRRALAEHEGILDALEARDGGEARKRMVEHINAWQKFFSAQFSEAKLRVKASRRKSS